MRAALTFSSELLPIDLAIRDWSRRDQAVAERLRRVDNRRMDYLRLLFGALCPDEDEAEARSMLVHIPLTEDERAAIDDGQAALDSLLDQLSDVPTPACPTPPGRLLER